MKPIIYEFRLNDLVFHPMYKDDLSIEYAMESGQQFFRKKLNGKIVFIGSDFNLINSWDFNQEMILKIRQSSNNGLTWNEVFRGRFMKTDCKWDTDNKRVEVQPEVLDDYNDVIAGLDKEYNLIQLSPETEALNIVKRPLIQSYKPGDNVISCFLGGTYWEQEVTEPVSDTNKLVNNYYFALASEMREINITANGASVPQVAGMYAGKDLLFNKKGGEYKITLKNIGENQNGKLYAVYIIRLSDNKELYNTNAFLGTDITTDRLKFKPSENSGVTGNPIGSAINYDIYMRYFLDVDKISDLNTYPIPTNDIVADNRNYKRCIGYGFDLAHLSYGYSDKPTKYGRNNDGKYYAEPNDMFGNKYYPLARSSWGNVSVWFTFDIIDAYIEQSARKTYKLKDTYPLASVINVLLEQFSDVVHYGTSDYSQFLYGGYNPVSYQQFTLLLTQKSNVLHGDYDQPAQKAMVTLNTILKALRDIYRCYWYIEDSKLKIEHISFFMNGGSYNSMPEIGTDLTELTNPKNGKKWGYLTSNYEFDKSDMPERYQFAWMDDVTEAFEGYPIEILSKYVSPGKIEDINVGSISTDIDYMLLNPSEISQDGFALFAAVGSKGNYSLPFVERNVNGMQLTLQNGYLSWITLQPNYYTSDLPAKQVVINNEDVEVYKTSRKRKQKAKFPTLSDLDPKKLVKTYIGNGQVEKITLNLSSRIQEVTLKYDTEQ